MPAAAVVTFVIEGDEAVEVNELGPLQKYVPPPPPVRFRVFPTQTGVLLLAVAVGLAKTVAVSVAEAVQPEFVTVTV